jgi:hypothetical protein
MNAPELNILSWINTISQEEIMHIKEKHWNTERAQMIFKFSKLIAKIQARQYMRSCSIRIKLSVLNQRVHMQFQWFFYRGTAVKIMATPLLKSKGVLSFKKPNVWNERNDAIGRTEFGVDSHYK